MVACLLSVVLVKNYFLSGPVVRPAARKPVVASVSVGSSLRSQLRDVDWSANTKTVLLTLSTHCHFCTESAPFFRQLSEKSGNAFKIIAVLPESVPEAEDYLRREGIRVDQVKQVSLDRLGVDGTPTMLLLNGKGQRRNHVTKQGGEL